MIAVALGLLGLVVMIATGVSASSTGDDHLTFLGVGVQTTTAQVFLTGAIFGWVFVIALWLLRMGMHRSGQRCAQLAARRSRRASEWLGFSEGEADGDGWDGWGEWDDWRAVGRRSGSEVRGSQWHGVRFRATTPLDAEGTVSGEIVGRGEVRGPNSRGVRFRSAAPRDAEGALPDGIVGRAGPAGHGRGAPWRADGGTDKANRAVAGAPDQPGALGGGHAPGPVAGRLPGIGVDGGAQRRQVGGGSGPVAGEDRAAEGE
ncbi:hypothetical protein ABH935_003178 [Catenulispora sp. GAS73]